MEKNMPMKKISLIALVLVLFGFHSCKSKIELNENVSVSLELEQVPLFIGRENKDIIKIFLEIDESLGSLELQSIELVFEKGSEYEFLELADGFIHQFTVNDTISEKLETNLRKGNKHFRLTGKQTFNPGIYELSLGFNVTDNAILEQSFAIEEVRLNFGRNGEISLTPETRFRFRPAIVLRAAGQDDCDTYRIPGIITTSNGTLIAVYDNRYNNSKDLQEDIDVGMSRSTDGGQIWEPMRVIMDMGEWGGRPPRLNGIGDPAVLYDHTTGTIWVAALWMSGSSPDKMLWWDSKPGMSPEETGQFVLVKSTDDGLTWSEPINITEKIKKPEWQLLLAGPGMGITLNDGTLVFAAQFKENIGVQAIDGGQYTSHSTIVYSKDGGETWHMGTGAKPNTTEAQVVQLTDGRLMLNMRDDLNRHVKDETNGRAVAITRDLGQMWEIHPSSNSALPEPNCMASLIAHDMIVDGKWQQVLFFSNPNSKIKRVNMTIKASFDGGNNWPENSQILLNSAQGNGYSCMTMVDDQTIGLIYEGVKELFFQKVPLKDFSLSENRKVVE
jgi:sialidase-1